MWSQALVLLVIAYTSFPSAQPTLKVAGIAKGGPAAGHLQRGDVILAVDGRRLRVDDVARALARHGCAGKPTAGCESPTPAAFTVRRGNSNIRLILRPRYDGTAKRMRVGITFGSDNKRLPLGTGIHDGFRAFGVLTSGTFTGLSHLLFGNTTKISSVVGVSRITHAAVRTSAQSTAFVAGEISLALGLLNLLPILPLDGGHLMVIGVERLRRRRLPTVAIERFTMVGLTLVLLLFAAGLSNDLGGARG